MQKLVPFVTAALFFGNNWAIAETLSARVPHPQTISGQRPVTRVPQNTQPVPARPIGHKMPGPGGGGTPVEVLRIKPLKEFVSLDGQKPLIAETSEGPLYYDFNEEGHLESEVLGQYGKYIVGRYYYDRHGRFDRIEYTDGSVIAGRYCANGKLCALYSNQGRGIGFTYREGKDGYTRDVSPTENSYEFHSAVALLRLKQPAPWWPETMEHAENVDEGDGAKTSLPEYPGNPFPNAPKTPGPDGQPIPTIPVSGERSDPGPPDHPEGVDLIPIGGNHGGNEPGGDGGRGGGGPVGEIKDAIDLARREVMIAQCRKKCSGTARALSNRCSSAPTFSDAYLCEAKVLNFEEKCQINCDLGDFTWEWTKQEPPVDYFPWKKDRSMRN